MFSGQMGNRRDADGRYFIDRDGTHFRYILNYLRDGTSTCPAALRDEVLAEARFYQLQELITALEGKANSFAAHQLAAKAMNVLRNRKGNDISQLREHLLSEFGRQAGSGNLTPVVAIYSTENSKVTVLSRCANSVSLLDCLLVAVVSRRVRPRHSAHCDYRPASAGLQGHVSDNT
jgi:hypothetical protein